MGGGGSLLYARRQILISRHLELLAGVSHSPAKLTLNGLECWAGQASESVTSSQIRFFLAWVKNCTCLTLAGHRIVLPVLNTLMELV